MPGYILYSFLYLWIADKFLFYVGSQLMLKIDNKPSIIIILQIIILLAVIFVGWLIYNGKLIDQKSFPGTVMQIMPEDEYVVVQLATNEEFSTEKYSTILGFPIGDTNAKLSLVAHYKYYAKLAELTHNIENGILYIHVPKLYLSTPVAFEFSSVREIQNESIFGPNGKILLDQLKKEVSGQLIYKGMSQINIVYDKAAKSLADNFNGYFISNGYGNYYKSIVVTISNEKSKSERQFNYNSSFCGKESCSFELDLGKGRTFTIK
jgi:hypothetical protein